MWFQKWLKKKNTVEDNVDLVEKSRDFDLVIKDILKYFDDDSCCCSFPRFTQVVSFSFEDFGHSPFFSGDTEKTIDAAFPYYEVEDLGVVDHEYTKIFCCPKCKSKYMYKWADFSIYIARTQLKPIEIHAKLVGAAPERRIPIQQGIWGYDIPTSIRKVSIVEFEKYMKEKTADQ